MGEDGGFLSSSTSGVPIEHLDYSYVKKCSNSKEIEKILKVLRSGEEGHYPELITFTENRLQELNPKSKSLRKDVPIKTLHDLDKAEKNEITEDLEEWMSEISDRDSKLLKSAASGFNDGGGALPPVRSSAAAKVSAEDQKPDKPKKEEKKGTGRVAPRTYDEWDRFDVEGEIQKQDKEEEKKREKCEDARKNPLSGKIPEVTLEGKSAEEIAVLASREKDKGNEAFRSGDFEEALVYYSRSIAYEPSAAAYNNRAFSDIKLEKFHDAIEDCGKVLTMEPNNIKAFLRRAIAHKGLSMLNEAIDDLGKVLSIEPNNKRAKELMQEWRVKDRNASNQDKKNLTSSETPEVKPERTTKDRDGEPASKGHKKGRRLKIIEVEGEEGAENTEEFNTETKIARAADDAGTTAESGENSRENAEETSNESRRQPSQNSSVSEFELPSDQRSDATAERSLPAAEGGPEEIEGAAGSSQSPSGSESRVKAAAAAQPELPGFVIKAKDEASELYALGRYAEAMEKYSGIIDVLSKEKSLYRESLSTLLGNRAACLNKIGDCAGSIKDCCAALELVPLALKPLLRRAAAYETLEKYPLAYRDYQTAMSVQPGNQHAMQGNTRVTKQLQLLYGEGWKERVKSTVPAVPVSQPLVVNEQKPDFRVPSGNKKGDKPVAKNQESSSVAAGGGGLIEQRGELTVAEKFQQSKERGNAMVKQGKLEEAVRCYTDCINTSPGEVASYTNRALCYLRLHKFELAEADSSAALKLQSDNVKALFRRAQARKGLKKNDSAARDLLDLIKIEPNNTAAKKELDIVLSLCREERRLSQEKSNSHGATDAKSKGRAAGAEKKQNETNASSQKQAKTPRRKRILIEEVQQDDEDAQGLNSTPQGRAENCSVRVDKTSNATKPSAPRQVDKPSAEPGTSAQLPKLTKPFDFLQAWNSVKKGDVTGCAGVLRRLDPKNLAQVIGNKLEAGMFTSMISALLREFVSKGEEKLAFEILSHLHEVQRFDMVLMFLSAKEKNELRSLFTSLENVQSLDGPRLNLLRQKFKV